MVQENFLGLESRYAWFYPGWRCVHCGEIIDPLILRNRHSGFIEQRAA